MIRKLSILVLILVTVFCGLAIAQTANPDTVFVTVTVTGPKKAPAPGLKAENFQILEDGVEQKTSFFAANDGLWDINILLASDLLRPGRADRLSTAIRDAVDTFQKTSNPISKIKIEELHFGSDGLYAAIDRNLVDLQKTTNPRRALVVITDGFDNAGGDAGTGLVEFSRKLNIPIYFIYTKTLDGSDLSTITDPTDPIPGRGGALAQSGGTRGSRYSMPDGEVLTMVAEQTGGAIYFVDPLHQLETQCKQLAEELRNKYVVGFKSTNDKQDDKWRKLKLKFTAPSGQKLDASIKAKYFVPKPLAK